MSAHGGGRSSLPRGDGAGSHCSERRVGSGGLCPLGVRQAGAGPQLSQDTISLRKRIIIGAGSGEESGVN